MGYSPWGHKELNMTAHARVSKGYCLLLVFGKGNRFRKGLQRRWYFSGFSGFHEIPEKQGHHSSEEFAIEKLELIATFLLVFWWKLTFIGSFHTENIFVCFFPTHPQ